MLAGVLLILGPALLVVAAFVEEYRNEECHTRGTGEDSEPEKDLNRARDVDN